MEINNSLLVAMMFVMILSIGIASILGALASIVQTPSRDLHWLPVAWIVLLLFSHLDLFWHTVLIVAVEDWHFTGFLYMLCGPVLLFLAANVLVTESTEGESVMLLKHYLEVSPYFFALLALLMLWTIGADYTLSQGISIFTTQYLIEFLIFLTLALRKNIKLHRLATVLTFAVVVLTVVARAFE